MFVCVIMVHRSIAEPVYAKKALLKKNSDAQMRVKLQRVGESVYEEGQWRVNDEEVTGVCCCLFPLLSFYYFYLFGVSYLPVRVVFFC